MEIKITIKSKLADALTTFFEKAAASDVLSETSENDPVEATLRPTPSPQPCSVLADEIPGTTVTPPDITDQTPPPEPEAPDLRTTVRNLANSLAVAGKKSEVRKALAELKVENLRDCPENKLREVQVSLQELSA